MFLVLVREIRGKCVLVLALLREKENLECFKVFRQNTFLQKTWFFAQKFLFLGNVSPDKVALY